MVFWKCVFGSDGMEKETWALQLLELRRSISRVQSFLLLLSTVTAYVIKVFDKKPASLQVTRNRLHYSTIYINN